MDEVKKLQKNNLQFMLGHVYQVDLRLNYRFCLIRSQTTKLGMIKNKNSKFFKVHKGKLRSAAIKDN